MVNGVMRNSFARVEHAFEEFLFGIRWVLVPAYLMLSATIIVLSYKTVEEFVQLVLGLRIFDEAHAILQVLTIVDLVLVINLVLMVVFVGYTNFVSKLNPDRKDDVQAWMSELDYSGLKLQMLGSIIAIASVKMLRTFLELTDSMNKIDDVRLKWAAIFYGIFLTAALLLSMTNKLKAEAEHQSKIWET